MKLELLISAVDKDFDELVKSMNLSCDAVIINQKKDTINEGFQREILVNGGKVRCFQYNEKGVGVSRNRAIENSNNLEDSILLFSDEDITYNNDLEINIIQSFEAFPDADMLLFNMKVCENRATYHTDKVKRIKWYNAGRYPTYSFAIRRNALMKSGVRFSHLFGGGAKYSNGEDSLFLKALCDKGLRILAVPVCIGEEAERESTWFHGYNEKFFFDRGVLYHFLYGKLAVLMGARFVYTKKSFMCKEIPANKAFNLLKRGIVKGKQEDRELKKKA